MRILGLGLAGIVVPTLLTVGLISHTITRAPVTEADKSADQIFGDMVSAMASLHSYHLYQTGKEEHGPASMDLTVRAPDTATGSISENGVSGEQLILGTSAYIRGGPFFREALPQVAPAIGDQWVRMPGDAGQFTFSRTSSIKRCMPLERGALSKGKVTTVQGHQAIELIDKGDRPGSGPGTYDIDTDGTPYLLRMTRTGGASGGGDSTCGDTKPSSGTFTVDFDRFNASVPAITAPTVAVDLPSPDRAYVMVVQNDYDKIRGVVAGEATGCRTSAQSCYDSLIKSRSALQQILDDIGPLKAPEALHGADVRLRDGLTKMLPAVDTMVSAFAEGDKGKFLSAAQQVETTGIQVDAAISQILQYSPPAPSSPPAAPLRGDLSI